MRKIQLFFTIIFIVNCSSSFNPDTHVRTYDSVYTKEEFSNRVKCGPFWSLQKKDGCNADEEIKWATTSLLMYRNLMTNIYSSGDVIINRSSIDPRMIGCCDKIPIQDMTIEKFRNYMAIRELNELEDYSAKFKIFNNLESGIGKNIIKIVNQFGPPDEIVEIENVKIYSWGGLSKTKTVPMIKKSLGVKNDIFGEPELIENETVEFNSVSYTTEKYSFFANIDSEVYKIIVD